MVLCSVEEGTSHILFAHLLISSPQDNPGSFLWLVCQTFSILALCWLVSACQRLVLEGEGVLLWKYPSRAMFPMDSQP